MHEAGVYWPSTKVGHRIQSQALCCFGGAPKLLHLGDEWYSTGPIVAVEKKAGDIRRR